MVATNAKRKKTADMPDSPPKRMTRARAAKVPDDEPQGPRTTKIVTPSTRAAAEKKKAPLPSKAAVAPKVPKRKTKVVDVVPEAVEEPIVEEPKAEDEQQSARPPKAKGRAKKATPAEHNGIQNVDAPQTRTRQPKGPATESVNSEPPKTRGRPKKVAEAETIASECKDQPECVAPGQVTKATRGRLAATTSKAATKTAAPRSTTVTTKKKVKFEEEVDKENIPVETAAPKPSAKKPAGLKAKPVRKPATIRAATTRGRKGVENTQKEVQEAEKLDSLPLSPKKVVQIAKSDPISEDELAGEKTPIRALSKSPTKRPISPLKDVKSVSKLSFAPSSTTKNVSSSILSSPARRPPPSPFKDGLKNSPVKLNFGDNIAQPVLLPSRTPMKASLLQESPKRGILADSEMKPILVAMRSPTKASLLQSPARRPPSSPTKLVARSSPEKTGTMAAANETIDLPSKVSPFEGPTPSLELIASSPFRAARSPEHTLKVHTITDEERQSMKAMDVDSVSQPTTSEGPDEAAGAVDLPQETDATMEDSIVSEDPLSVEQAKPSSDMDEKAETPIIQEATAVFAGSVFSIGSSSLRRISMESDTSEDELASPEKSYKITSLGRNGISTKDFGTPAVVGGQDLLQTSNNNLSFTPLADQLSSWNASSPDKQNKRPRQARGIFSFGGAEVVPIPSEISAGVQTASPVKTSFFEDEMIMRDDQDDPSHDESIVIHPSDVAALSVSQESLASDEYGDENAIPSDPNFLGVEQEAEHTLTCTPAKVFTPVKAVKRPLEMHTVSKVPLRPSDEDSPFVLPRQRSRSFGGPLAVVNQPETKENVRGQKEQPVTPKLAPTLAPQTPSSGMRLDAETPGRTVRKGVVPDVLKGAVVYVDVHTTEGADASGIFVDLLTQMGARCVKQWNWNPRASMGNSLDSGNASPQGTSPDASVGKIGITHVVYKDGGKRTLEKVRGSNGVVLCVGVGWVLE